MQRRRKQKNKVYVSRWTAFFWVFASIAFSIFLISSANTPVVQAGDENLKQVLSEKDTRAEAELLIPSVDLGADGKQESSSIPNANTINSNDNGIFSVQILPAGSHQSIDSTISIVANNNIDEKLLKESFTIIPNVAGRFVVSGKVASFYPLAPLAPQTKYQVNVFGVNEVFETRAETHILPVPYFRQEFGRSCEAASLRMALAYYGTITNDEEIVRASGYNPREPDWAHNIWDDPYEQFVGFLTGKQIGYGMYATALQKGADAMGHDSKVISPSTPKDIANELWNDHPVVVWGYINNTVPKMSYFTTDSGKRVPVYSNEHARVVVGVVGRADAPVGFYLHDPLSGKANEYWSAERLQEHMNTFGRVSNQALVVE